MNIDKKQYTKKIPRTGCCSGLPSNLISQAWRD